jgi:hypothetical protein
MMRRQTFVLLRRRPMSAMATTMPMFQPTHRHLVPHAPFNRPLAASFLHTFLLLPPTPRSEHHRGATLPRPWPEALEQGGGG